MTMCPFGRTARMHCLRAQIMYDNNDKNNNDNVRFQQDREDALPRGTTYYE